MTNQIKKRIDQINRGEIPEGFKRIVNSVVPLEWEQRSLGKLFDFYGGLGKSRDELGDVGIPYLHYGDMHRNTFTKVTYDQYLNEPKYDTVLTGEETFLLNDGDVVFLDASEDLAGTARTVMVDNNENQPFISGLHTIIGKSKKNYLHKEFKKYITEPFYVKKQFMRLASGFKVYGINRETIKQIEYAYPKDISEQQKIAKILSEWDEAVLMQDKLIEKLQLQKKALLQKLLSPRKDWKPIAIEKILKEVTNKTDINNQYPVISSTKLGLFLQSEYFDNEVASKENAGYKILLKGQIVLSPQNLWLGNINFNDKYDIGMVSPSYKVFEIKEKYNKIYVSTVMKLPKLLYQYVLSSEQGASVVRRNLNMDLFNQIVIYMPSRKEQDELSEIITCSESRIQYEIIKLEKIKQQRRAMQQLLLTGIIRVI